MNWNLIANALNYVMIVVIVVLSMYIASMLTIILIRFVVRERKSK